ncbi:MAG TPA: IS1595 family transposase [Pyrinomonadaceae bacterium]|jgi:transposase-like protein
MVTDKELPKTLQQAIKFFSDELTCIKIIASRRWKDGVAVCPKCNDTNNTFLQSRNVWQCKNKGCRKQFSVKVGTIFEDSPVGLDKWLTAVWLITSAKNGISSYEIHRAIGVTQKTAWFMMHRIRLAMENGSFEKLSGNVEVDETFIGGKAKNMHKAKREKVIQGRGSVGKTVVFGALERKGRVLAKVIERTDRETLHTEVKNNVETGANLFSDEWLSYRGLDSDYIHQVINHSIEYVKDNVHTNGIENFWALLKRTLKGTYVSVEPFHLSRYLAEQTFRFNERKLNDKERFIGVLKAVSGKRLTYDELRGIGGETSH